nr:photosystem I subunit VIII [Sicyos edulis]QOE55957.1 photosystem I subunit VIII [Sicyos edulis]
MASLSLHVQKNKIFKIC